MTTVGSFLPVAAAWLRRLVVARAHPALTSGVIVTLARGQACTLEPAPPSSQLIVVTGVVWATTTPPDEGDVVLRAGDVLVPGTNWPVVMEALEDARVRIR